jgi:class 3 adenylate cyclase
MSEMRSLSHRPMMVIDIASFGDPLLTDDVRAHLRTALYGIVVEAFESAGMSWARCYHEDRGDGVLILSPPEVPHSLLVDSVLPQMATRVRRHNKVSSAVAKIRLRIAVHAGAVAFDGLGVVGSALNHTFRLLEAPSFKETLAASGLDVALIISDYFYDDVVRHGLSMLDPADYAPIHVQMKGTSARGWVYIPGWSAHPRSTGAPSAGRSKAKGADDRSVDRPS